jgi:hypothetical protein
MGEAMKIIEEARQAWKLWSIRIAAIAGIVAGIIASNQSIALGLVYFLPEGIWRIVAGAGIGLVVFVIPTLARLMKQQKLEKTDVSATEQN